MSPTLVATDDSRHRQSHVLATLSAGFAPGPVGRVALAAVLLCAPYEALRPLWSAAGQSLSTVEVVVLLALVAWVSALVISGTRPWMPGPVAMPAVVLLMALSLAAVAAPASRANALHMTARLGLAACVALLAANVVQTVSDARRLLLAAAVSGALAGGIVIVDYTGWPPLQGWLSLFRVQAASVGGQVRASGSFQYPTIASMFLEVCFACGLGVLPAALTRGRAVALSLSALLVTIALAIILTFTRAGLVTMGSSLVIVGGWHAWRHGFDATTRAVAGLALAILALLPMTRGADAVRLRLMSEQQERWYRAAIEAPPSVTLAAGRRMTVPITLTNTGDVTWDSQAVQPFGVSSHWLLADRDSLVSWEGLRTAFPRPVAPGETVTVPVVIEAPAQPGEYRVVWDLYQEHVLWFSTEPDAELTISRATVSGSAAGAAIDVQHLRAMPLPATRPGRLVLWTAAARMLSEHPWLGVGLDNFRLLYGPYARLARPDPRVHTNNMYLELVVGGGGLTALALGWLLVTIASVAQGALRSATAGPRDPTDHRASVITGVVAAATAIAVHGLVDSFLGFTATYAAIGIVLGLLVASSPRESRHAHRV